MEFVWILKYPTATDRRKSKEIGDYIEVPIHTQTADGEAGKVKQKIRQEYGVKRHLLKGFVKIIQWRRNSGNIDISRDFLHRWGELETMLRDGFFFVIIIKSIFFFL